MEEFTMNIGVDDLIEVSGDIQGTQGRHPGARLTLPASVEPRPHVGPEPELRLGAEGRPLSGRMLDADDPLGIWRADGETWDRCATLIADGDKGVLVQLHSQTDDAFVRIEGRVPLFHGDRFRAGGALFVYSETGSPDPWGQLERLSSSARARRRHLVSGRGVTIGREGADVLVPGAGYVSRRHCRVAHDKRGSFLEDLRSTNGTYVRMRSGGVVPYGTTLLIDNALFHAHSFGGTAIVFELGILEGVHA